MKKSFIYALTACLFIFSKAQTQTVFDPTDPVITYNPSAPAGSASNPNVPVGVQITKWVREQKMGWNTDKFKCYTVGNIPFRLRYPNSYAPNANDGKKYPLILFFHGGGEADGDIRDNELSMIHGAQQFEQNVNNGVMDAYLLFPQSKTVGWDDSYFSPVNVVLDSLIQNGKVDPDRIIVMGLSIGGMAVVYYTTLYPKRVARAIPSSPSFISSFVGSVPNIIHIPFWIGSGGQDTNPDPGSVQVFTDAMKNQGGSFIWNLYPDLGHFMWYNQWAEPILPSQWNSSHKANPLVFFDKKYFCPDSPAVSKLGVTPGFFAYQWDKDGTIIPGATSNEYTTNGFGSYRARFMRTSSSGWSDWSPNPAVITPTCPPIPGNGTGLKGSYFNNIALTTPATLVRTDGTVNFSWGNGSPDPSIPVDNFSVRWTGKVQPMFTETYTFYTTSDDGIRLWVNGVQLINNWTDHGPTENSGSIALVANQKYDIKIEFYEKGGGATAQLLWSSPSVVKNVIPQTQLYPFGTGDPVAPACTNNLLPANGAVTATYNSAALSWATADNAASYDVYLWTGATAPSTPTANVTVNAYNATGLTGATLYNWYIVPKNIAGAPTGCIANKTSFTTSPPPPPPPVCTTNTAPADSTVTAAYNTATLTWNAAATATSYDVYLWTGTTAPASPFATVNTNSYTATGLIGSVLYRWYVVPKNAGGSATGCNTSTTRFITAAPPIPTCSSNASPANAATITTYNNANLSWISSPAATSYDVYLWTGATAPSVPTANVSSNSYTAAGLTGSTIYNWYVVPRNITGTAIGCDANTTTFTTAIPPPPCAINLLPVNGSTTPSYNAATLTWGAAATATSYDVYLWTGATEPILPTTNVTTPAYSATGLSAATPYSWYVVPRNASGSAAACGLTNITGFTTAPPPGPGNGIGLKGDYFNNITVTGTPVISRTDTTVNFDWQYGSPDPAIGNNNFSARWTGQVQPLYSETYTFYTISDDAVRLWVNGVQIINNWTAHGTTENSATVALTGGQKYDIVMEYFEGGGAATAKLSWSSASTPKAPVPKTQLYPPGFVDPTPPSCTVNTLPLNGATVGTQTTASLAWTAAATATSYDVYVWTGVVVPSVPTANVTTTAYSATSLTASTTYNWYIVPKNGAGAAAGCISNKTSFITADPPPACAANTLPADGSTVAGYNTATLNWNAVATATSYDVYTWTGAVIPSVPTANVTTNSYIANGLTASTTYNWYVVPKNNSGSATGCSSNKTSFVTAPPPPPPCVTNITPANAATISQSNTATLTWNSTASATSYDVYIWTGAIAPSVPITNVSTLTYTAINLDPSTTYTWYVVPRNASGADNTCGVNATSFTTNMAPPSCTSLVAPADNETVAGYNTANLSWNPAATATSYDVYIWTGATIPSVPTVNVSTTSYTANGLSASTVYRWYIVPKNEGGTALNCNASQQSFTTAPPPPPLCTANISPANGTVTPLNTSAVLTWNAAATATSYDVYIWTGAVVPSAPTATVTTTTYTAIGLTSSTVYNWYVVPANGTGSATGCSANATSFTTAVPPPACTSNLLPLNNATVAGSSSASLSWSAAATATSYDVFIWTGAITPSVPVANVSTTSYSATGLNATTVYNWYIVPKNNSGSATGCSTSKTSFTTADAPPSGTGLRADYFNNITVTGTPALTQTDTTVNFDWQWGSPGAAIGNNNFSARWTGQVQPLFTQTYTFYVTTDDGVRLWVNGVQLVDNWVNQGATEKSGTIALAAGQKYDIVMEYYEGNGGALAKLSWSSASTPKAIIPKTQLYLPPPPAAVNFGGLHGNAGTDISTESLRPASIAPNPVLAGQAVRLNIFSGKIGKAAVQLISSNGFLVKAQQVSVSKGANQTMINTTGLSKGVYIIRVSGDVMTSNIKLIIE